MRPQTRQAAGKLPLTQQVALKPDSQLLPETSDLEQPSPPRRWSPGQHHILGFTGPGLSARA